MGQGNGKIRDWQGRGREKTDGGALSVGKERDRAGKPENKSDVVLQRY